MRTFQFYKPQDIPAEHYKKMFGIKSICKEMYSDKLYCDDGDEWLLMFQDGELAAFSCVKYRTNGMWLEHDYVFPEYRHRGLHKAMINIRLMLEHETAYASCVPASRENYLSAGFERIENKNGFIVMRVNI